MIMKRFIYIGAVLGLLWSAPSLHALSVDEAYKAIPHQQTPYNSQISKLPHPTKLFLNSLFEITDLAVVARVEHLTTLYYYKGRGDTGNFSYNRTIDTLIRRLQNLKPPAAFKKPHGFVLNALKEQKAFFGKWASASSTGKRALRKSYRTHPLVQSSHQKLIAAYNELMRLFPKETKHNKQAFFDHLCALDFI